MYVYTYVHTFTHLNRGGHLLAAVLNVVIHDSGGATRPRSISIGNSVRPANFGVCYRRRRIFSSNLFPRSSSERARRQPVAAKFSLKRLGENNSFASLEITYSSIPFLLFSTPVEYNFEFQELNFPRRREKNISR